MAVEMAQEMGVVSGTAEHVVRVGSADVGVHLTWQDLWVTASNGKDASHVILSGLTGYAQPGSVLAIMGPSGCGKTTLLNALAGRLGTRTKQSGHILVNGRRQRLSFGNSAYVTQDDILMTTLTVREAVYYSAELQLPKTMTRSEKRERAETTIRDMGLQAAMDARIGGNFSSTGISGGQKRRVSICIQILTHPKLLFLDEPTSGLDSAASYHVMSRIVNLAKHDGRTVLASIHQPGSGVFELFDDLCLLSDGKTVYFGPTSGANEFFALNGFACPTFINPSDHYLRTVNKDFDEELEEGSSAGLMNAAKAIDVLTTAYKQSKTCQYVERRVAEICNMVSLSHLSPTLDHDLVAETNQSPLLSQDRDLAVNRVQVSFFTQVLVLTKRSLVNMHRDLGYYWLRLAVYLMLCLCIGTLFHDIGHSYGSIQARGSVLMFVGAFLTFMAIGGFPSFVEDMKIFGGERLNGHYGVAAFMISNTLSSAPFLALVSLIPAASGYYLIGLQRGFDHFLFFCLVLFASMMVVEGLMMIVASVVPNYLMGIISGAGIQGLMMLSGGFFRLPGDLPKPVWKYPMYYIAFHKYANQGYYKNEFVGLTFPSNQAGGAATITGEEVVRDYWQMEVGYSKWVDLAILFAMVILYRLLFLVAVKMSEKVKPLLADLLNAPPKRTMQVVGQPLED
ncbi:ABC transporter G family member [Musa troglodytarum]|uniref:ABC transporter G family member n=1 Tax=Musa troglodytarum TaxID=320322 RepID=A0A9E7EBI4_9LILI|nr:ABC transporter G family member [Musa troglodytarum]